MRSSMCPAETWWCRVMADKERTVAELALRRSLMALRLEVPREIVDDVEAKVNDALQARAEQAEEDGRSGAEAMQVVLETEAETIRELREQAETLREALRRKCVLDTY